jgi:hypothetical protein
MLREGTGVKFSMSAAWNDAVALLRANRQVVLVVAGVFFFLPYLAMILLMPDYAATVGGPGAPQPATMDEALEQISGVYRDIWWAALLLAVVQGIGMLGLLALLTDRDRPTVGEALAKGAKYFLPYLGTQILIALIVVALVMVPVTIGAAAGAGAGVLVGLLAAVAIVYLLVKFSLTTPVIVVDGVMNPIAALGRSWALTKGNSLRLFLFYLLLFIVLIVVSMVLTIPIGIVTAMSGGDGAVIVSGLVNALLNLVALTVILAVVAAIHRQLSGAAPAAVSATFE